MEATIHEWGQSAQNPSDWGQEDNVDNIFGKLYTKYVANGIPVIIGECGAVHQNGYEDFRRYYMEYVVRMAKVNGLVPVYWDNGSAGSGRECSGLFDRNTCTVNTHAKKIIEAMIKAATTEYTKIELP